MTLSFLATLPSPHFFYGLKLLPILLKRLDDNGSLENEITDGMEVVLSNFNFFYVLCYNIEQNGGAAL